MQRRSCIDLQRTLSLLILTDNLVNSQNDHTGWHAEDIHKVVASVDTPPSGCMDIINSTCHILDHTAQSVQLLICMSMTITKVSSVSEQQLPRVQDKWVQQCMASTAVPLK